MALCLFDPAGRLLHDARAVRRVPATSPPRRRSARCSASWSASGCSAPGGRSAGRSPVTLAEIGPGRGTLMKDMLRTLDRLDPGFSRRRAFAMVETSPRLGRHPEGDARRDGRPRSAGTRRIDDAAAGAAADRRQRAVRRRSRSASIVKAGGRWLRARCRARRRRRACASSPAPARLDPALLPPDAAMRRDGAIVEIAPARTALMDAIAERIASAWRRRPVHRLRPSRARRSATRCRRLAQHATTIVLANPGEADLTAHVDFAALARKSPRARPRRPSVDAGRLPARHGPARTRRPARRQGRRRGAPNGCRARSSASPAPEAMGDAVQGAGRLLPRRHRRCRPSPRLGLTCAPALPHSPRPDNEAGRPALSAGACLTKPAPGNDKAAHAEISTKPDPLRSPAARRIGGSRHPPRLFHPRRRRLRRHLPGPQHRHRIAATIRSKVRENRRRVAALDGRARRPSADRPPGPFARRRHRARSRFRASARRPTPSSPTGRASPLGASTADCGPVLFADAEARVIGAAHAGWKGAFTGVLENTDRRDGGPRRQARAHRRRARPLDRPAKLRGRAGIRRTLRRGTIPATRAISRPRAKPGHAMFDLNRYTVDRLAARRRDAPRGSTAAPMPRRTCSTPTGARRTARKPDYGRQISAIVLENRLMALHFERTEFDARRDRLMIEMAEKKLDAMLLFAQESMYWLTGYDTFGFCFFQCLVREGRRLDGAAHPLGRPAAGAPHLDHRQHRAVDRPRRRQSGARPAQPAQRPRTCSAPASASNTTPTA